MDSMRGLLDTYRGRDCVIRTVGYLSLYLSGRTSGKASRKWKTLSKELSYCRVILRLFDDFPMLQFSVNYGFGHRDEPYLLRILGVIKNLLDQTYYPIEHIAWAADKNLMTANSSLLYVVGTALWGLSSYIGIIRSIIMMSILQSKTRGLKNVVLHEKIVGQQMEVLLEAFKDAADVILAVNSLPRGALLWAGKLTTKQIGLIGSASSLIRLSLLLRNLHAHSKERSLSKD